MGVRTATTIASAPPSAEDTSKDPGNGEGSAARRHRCCCLRRGSGGGGGGVVVVVVVAVVVVVTVVRSHRVRVEREERQNVRIASVVFEERLVVRDISGPPAGIGLSRAAKTDVAAAVR